ncbi:NAD(P)/FAD-dependent oxidoreductase [Geothrix sp. PMB-07]|uniref:protoporphyrinogen/coproporphyrinogen oxidase n=1 Tax=Geothrix sp. PMB-07 TaxID=3068640 RepID=UPI0027422640|nr:FAD-dependent oxidoreductase [Geothrix sp. PMB-07]WLT29956.1 FAD-dependent oxidoreductase [Geothrix sp. PMB-07]
MSTLILGGGVTGLAAAWHLQQRGEAVEVWEAGASVGGWMKTLPWEGGHFETGPQGVLWQKGTAVDRLFSAIDLPFKSPGTGARWVGKGGRLIPVPASPPALMFSPLMSAGAKLRMVLEPFIGVRDPEPEEGLSAFITRRLGKGVATELLPAMVAGILAAPPEILSVDAIPKLKQWEATGSLVNGIRKSGVSHMVVPEGGMGQLPIRLASKLSAVRTGLRAERLERLAEGRWRVSGGGEVREADRVVLALPAFEAAALLGPVAAQSAEALAAIPYTSVDLWHSRHLPLPALKDSFGFLIHPPEGRGYLGSLVPSWMDPQSAPEGVMQLRSFIGGAFGKPADLEQWEGIAARLKHWIPTLSDATAVRHERADRAIPRPELGHRGRVKAALEGLPGGIDWLSNARFGPGVRDILEGLESWTF